MMMRNFFLFFLILLPVFAICQISDSTEINLRKYKDLFEKGLIDKEEFDALKAKELNIVSVKIDLKKEITNENLIPKWNENRKAAIDNGFSSGALAFLGFGGIIGGYFLRKHEIQKGKEQIGSTSVFALGGTLMIGSVVTAIVAAKQWSRRNDPTKEELAEQVKVGESLK